MVINGKGQTLQQVHRSQFRSQFTAILVVWLAVFAPVTCQYHGLILRFSEPPDHHHGHNAPGHDHSSNTGHLEHKPPTEDTASVSILILAFPGTLVLRSPFTASSLVSISVVLPPQHTVLPPDQPPRLLSR